MNWQSSKVKPPTLSRATSQASATLEASVIWLNMLSPKKARPSRTPYRPPTSSPSCQTSIEWAWPVGVKREHRALDLGVDPGFLAVGAGLR